MKEAVLIDKDDSKDAETVWKLFKEAKVLSRVQIVCDGAAAIAYLEGSGKYADRSLFPYAVLLTF
jgi:hypothetical protein